MKFFCNSRKNGRYVFVYNKTDKKLFESEISNVSVERNFYRLELAEQPLGWEDFYSKEVEPFYGTDIKQLVESVSKKQLDLNNTVLSEEIKAILAQLIIHQLIRGRGAREFMDSYLDRQSCEIKEIAYTRFRNYLTPSLKERIDYLVDDPNMRRIAMADASLNNTRILRLSALLLERVWVLLKTEEENEFLTSDNPVMFLDHDTQRATAFTNGLLSPSTVVYYPLSFNLVIVLYPKLYKNQMIEMKDKLVVLDRNTVCEFVETINKKQIEQCKRQAFAKSRETFEAIVELDGKGR